MVPGGGEFITVGLHFVHRSEVVAMPLINAGSAALDLVSQLTGIAANLTYILKAWGLA